MKAPNDFYLRHLLVTLPTVIVGPQDDFWEVHQKKTQVTRLANEEKSSIL
jgi:hypothetical protein